MVGLGYGLGCVLPCLNPQVWLVKVIWVRGCMTFRVKGRSPWPRYGQCQRNNGSSNINGYGRSVAFPRVKQHHTQHRCTPNCSSTLRRSIELIL